MNISSYRYPCLPKWYLPFSHRNAPNYLVRQHEFRRSSECAIWRWFVNLLGFLLIPRCNCLGSTSKQEPDNLTKHTGREGFDMMLRKGRTLSDCGDQLKIASVAANCMAII